MALALLVHLLSLVLAERAVRVSGQPRGPLLLSQARLALPGQGGQNLGGHFPADAGGQEEGGKGQEEGKGKSYKSSLYDRHTLT